MKKSISTKEEAYQAIVETGNLLRSPKNAERLREAIKDVASGKSVERSLLPDED